METCQLVCHPDTPPVAVTRIAARITPDGDWLRLRWRIEGASALFSPKFAGKGRADNLWQSTCFELFLRQPGEQDYIELNLSPSERWAAYAFRGYREGMAEHPMPREPNCTMRLGQTLAIFDAAVPMATLPSLPWECAMTAVIEESGGTKSYWAVSHPGGKPDFHDPSCFTARVPAPDAT